MAKGFCLTKEIADNLKAQAVKGEIDIAKMYEMTSEQRSSLFEKWVDRDTAQKINAGFEEAMVSSQQTALKRWAEATFTGSDKLKTRKKDIYDKIDGLKELGVLNPKNTDAFLSDLVATKLGVTITAEESAILVEKASQLEQLASQKSEFGTPTLEYFKARNDIENYMESLTPSSNIKVATSLIGRGSMLFSLKSPLLNIESNTIQALITGLERRILSRKANGENSSYALKYMKFVNKVYKDTGFDISRMRTLEGEQTVRGEQVTTAQGNGITRKIGRFYEDVVFKKLMGAPDVAFSSAHFADSANIGSTLLAELEGNKGESVKKRALEIFQDSTSINPATKEGRKVRDQAIADAEYATYTNDSKYSEIALGIRRILNMASGDFRLGDQLMPFVKTPANVVGAGLEYSGVLLPIDTLVRVAKIFQEIKQGATVKEATLNNLDNYSKKVFKAGLGMTLAFALASLFDPDDFIGEYPVSTKEQELLRLQNATTNSVRIGDKWVSLDYFGALGSPLVAMLYARKYGDTLSDKVANYYIGAGRQMAKIPGLEIGKDVFETLNRTKFEGINAVKDDLTKMSIDYIRSRTIPAFVYDLAKATDKYERQVKEDNPIDAVINTIPQARKTLPIKQTVFGQDVETENAMATLFLGSRVKTVNNNKVIEEISRLSQTGNLPSITDYAKTSSRFKELQQQIGDDKFREAQDYLGDNLYKRFEKAINAPSYNRLTDEQKAERLNSIKTGLLEETLKKYRYRPKK